MRKITLLLSLCAALFTGTTQASAQTQPLDGYGIKSVGAAVSSVDNITDGYYIVWNANRTGGMYENSNGQVMLGGGVTTTNIVGSENVDHVVYIEKTDDGNYTFKYNSGKYLPVIGSGTTPTTSETAAEFVIEALATPRRFYDSAVLSPQCHRIYRHLFQR